MSAKKVTKAVTGSAQVATVEEGQEAAAKYLAEHADAGFKNLNDLVFTYLVPYALRRLDALDRYTAKNPPKPKKVKAPKAKKAKAAKAES